jgi:hypothetical protein
MTTYWSNYKEITFDELEDPNHKITSTKITCILLQIKRQDSKQSSRQYSIYQNKGKGQSYFSNMMNVSYDRIFLLGLVNKKGFCIAVLSPSSSSSSFLMSKLDHSTSNIGKTIVILEPTFEGKSLSKNSILPLITTNRKFIQTDLLQRYPSPFDTNMTIGQTRYFMLYDVSITLEGLVILNADCAGIECDRLLIQGKVTRCACTYSKMLSPLTMQTLVSIQESNGNKLFSSWFQSLKLTQLFLIITLESSLSDFEDEALEIVRSHINNVVHYINHNGGWNVCGWMRLGSITDNADIKGGEEIASDTINPHIISLYPSNNSEAFTTQLETMKYRPGIVQL